jgi:hypothetical protein
VRSRPDLEVYFTPAKPTPGAHLRVEAVLRSRSETPIDGVEAHFVGLEERGLPRYSRAHRLVDLLAEAPGAVLAPGEHRFAFGFDIPPGAPPSYGSGGTAIAYHLEICVRIPWWPDRSARYAVHVVAAPGAATLAPVSFRTSGGGGLHVEASLETATVPVGGVIRGEISLAGAARHHVRRVDLALVRVELGSDDGVEVERERYLAHLHEGAPPAGQALPFQVALPPHAVPTFAAALFDVRWRAEIHAVTEQGDVVLRAPFEVIREAEGGEPGPAGRPHVPLSGHERLALIWAESARRNGLESDAGSERMTFEAGAVSLVVTLEPRGSGGLAYTASAAWPRLGIDLAVTERRWVDAWSAGAVPIDAPGFADRFTVRGREAARVRAFLDEACCRALMLFDEAAVGDEGATLVSHGSAQSLEELDSFAAPVVGQELDAFVARALAAAHAFDEAVRRLSGSVARGPYR